MKRHSTYSGRHCAFASSLVVAVLGWADVLEAALPIDLEVAVVKAAPFGAMQEWGKLLAEMDLARVRLRGAHAGDEPSVTPTGGGAAQRFRVVGILSHRDQLILPGGAFGHGDVARLRAFFEALPVQVAERGVERGIFGLTKAQFQQIFGDLSAVVEHATKGSKPEAALAAMTTGLTAPLEMDAMAKTILSRAKPLRAELKGLSAGTAIAILLRSAGLELVPEQPPGKPLVMRIVPATPAHDHWPAGWKPEEAPRQVAPAMYRFTTIEITGFTLEQALEALTPHMGVPLVFDERVLAVRQIDPATIQVKFPIGKTYIRRAVDRILSQARLAGELRIDEAGRPFYWITQFGPDNLPAKSQNVERGPNKLSKAE